MIDLCESKSYTVFFLTGETRVKSKYKILTGQIKFEYGLKLSAGTVQSLVASGYDTARKAALCGLAMRTIRIK